MAAGVTKRKPQPIDPVFKGQTFPIRVTAKKADVKQNITGAVITFTVRSRKDSPDPPLIQLDSTNNPTQVIVLTPQTDADKLGRFTVTLNPSDTEKIPAGEYIYDIKMVLAAVTSIVVAPNKFVLRQPVTR